MKIEISNGEFLDRISILQIKIEKFKSEEKKKNIQIELDLLLNLLQNSNLNLNSEDIKALYEVNLALWNTEDSLREKERQGIFDDAFIELARKVYILNDERARLKKMINQKTSSFIIEEKEYSNY